MEIFISIILIAGLGFLIFNQLKTQNTGNSQETVRENERLKSELAQVSQKLSQTESELKQEKSEKDKLSGQNKEMWAAKTKLEQQKEELADKVAKFEANEARKEKELESKLKILDSSKESLEDEKQRIRREDEERVQKEIEERDRMWNEHENAVISTLNEICRSPEYNFKTFDNTNLPEGFDGSLKPDFMIDFLDQYIIFDAKSSRSDNLQTYLNDNVKKTAKKLKGKSEIYPSVFFVIPTEAISELKKTYFYEDGFTFYIISPEAIAPIFAALKKISNYEFAEQMSPQDRENIVNLLAEFDYHINLRNAFDILSAKIGVNILEKAKQLDPEMQDEIAMKKSEIRLENFTPTEIKKLLDAKSQTERIHKFISPKAEIDKKDIEELTESLTEKEDGKAIN